MSQMAAALWVEVLKIRRSKVLWLSALGLAIGPLVGGLFMLVIKNPEWARGLGLVTAKAQITAGTADWPAYFGLLAQMMAMGGFFVFGLVLVWVFGREFTDGTAKDLLALPTSRAAIVGAKFAVVTIWSAVLAMLVYALGLGVGHAVVLPGWSAELALDSAARLAVTALLTIMLVWPFALAASAGRGYLPPFGFMLLALISAQVIAVLGWGAYYPWAVPALYGGAAGPDTQTLGPISLLLVALVGAAGVAATLAWWRYADQT